MIKHQILAIVQDGEIIAAQIETTDETGKVLPAQDLKATDIPKELSGAVMIEKHKKLQDDFDALKVELSQAEEQASIKAQEAVSAIRETTRQEVVIEKQRRLMAAFGLTEWEEFLQLREAGVREASELLTVIQSGDATDDQHKRAAQLQGASDVINSIESKAKEILSREPLPMNVKQNELWA